MALAQQIQLQGETGARDRARRLTGSPALRLVGRRLLAAIPVLIGVTFLTFTVMSALPNDTAQAILGLHASPSAVIALNHSARPRPAVLAAVLALAGQRAARKLRHHRRKARASTTNSPSTCRPPSGCCCTRWWSRCCCRSSWRRSRRAGRTASSTGSASRSACSGCRSRPYAFAFLLIIVFAVKLNWFPVLSGPVTGPGSFFKNLTLPACAIGFGLFAIYTRLLRADIVEQMQREDYIVTAKAKGVAPWRVLIRHALRNSMFTLITVIGLNLGGLVGAAAIIETIFQVQGIGNDLLTGIANHDVPLVEGITLVFALVTVLGNLLADLAYAVLDPRIRYGSSTS